MVGPIFGVKGVEPFFIKGVFVKGQSGKVTFQCNPQGLLTSTVLCSFPAASHPGLTLDVEVLAKFGATPSRFSSELPIPFIRTVRSSAGLAAVTEPSSNILPLEFVADVAHHSGGDVLAGIGFPENSLFPTLDFADYSVFNEDGRPTWARIVDMLRKKYEKQAGKDEKGEDNLAQVFVNRLTRYWDKDTKTVLIYPGRWSNFPAVSLAQTLMRTTKVNFSVLHMAHSLTNVRNVYEMNPLISGINGEHNFSKTSLFLSPVCVGYTHNFFFFLLSKGDTLRYGCRHFNRFTRTVLVNW